MKIIYIDAGAFKGKIIKRFMAKHPNAIAYAFECNPYLSKIKYGENISVIHSALWIYDGEMPLYINPRVMGIEGHSAFPDKMTGGLDRNNPITVKCIDFDNWLKESFLPGKNIIHLKMNIEGAEYPVLEHCINGKSIELINHLYIHWHHQKIPSISTERHNALIKKLNYIPSLTLHNGYRAI